MTGTSRNLGNTMIFEILRPAIVPGFLFEWPMTTKNTHVESSIAEVSRTSAFRRNVRGFFLSSVQSFSAAR